MSHPVFARIDDFHATVGSSGPPSRAHLILGSMAAQGTSSATSGPGPSPLSAEDMVALATTLLPSLLLLRPPYIPVNLLSGLIYKRDIEWLAGWVRAARPDLKELADACTHGVALALLSLSAVKESNTFLGVLEEVGDATCLSEEAVAAFYATLHSNSVLVELTIGGAAFGTPAAAAHLGRCLNHNSTLRELRIIGVDGFGGEAAWTALSEALTSNATIQKLEVDVTGVGMSGHMSAKFAEASHKLSALRVFSLDIRDGERATLGDVAGWGQMLAHERCPITEIDFAFGLTSPGGGLAAVCEAIRSNTTVKKLTIRGPREVQVIEDADAEALAAMLRTNRTLKTLDMSMCGIQWNAMVVDQGLSCNNSLEELAISLDRDGPYPLLTLLQQSPAEISPTSTATATSSSTCPAQLQKLRLGDDFNTLVHKYVHKEMLSGWCNFPTLAYFQGLRYIQYSLQYPILHGNRTAQHVLGEEIVLHMLGEKCSEWPGFPTATALRNMLASNRTLLLLDLSYAPYSKEEWADTILPALVNNQSLEHLDLNFCNGVDGERVYNVLLQVLESNTRIQDIHLFNTPLEKQGRAAVVREKIRVNKEYRAAFKDVPTMRTNACRLVLCGFPHAGKTTLLETMMRLHRSHYQQIMKKLAIGNWPKLCTGDDKDLSRRTRGIDIHPLKIEDLTVWMWDFAGQTEFHSLLDFIFPDGSSVHAATTFVFMFNPIFEARSNSGQGSKSEDQFKTEFSYWLKFIGSNAKPRPTRASKPLVLVVITHRDELPSGQGIAVLDYFKEWVRDIASKFEHLVPVDAKNVFLVNATDKYDKELKTFVEHTLSELRKRISNVANVPAICDAVGKALRGGSLRRQDEPIISLKDFEKLCTELMSLSFVSNMSSDNKLKLVEAIGAYLHDAGEVLYFPNLHFIVRNPRWFAHGILGYLVNISSDHDPNEDEGGYAPSTFCCVMKSKMQQMRQQHTIRNGLVSKDFLSGLLETALKIVGLNLHGVGTDQLTDQLIQLMEELDLCYKTEYDGKYLLPALLEDLECKAEKGEQQRSWKPLTTSSATLIFVSRRLQCSDPSTFLTPGFFPRLQVVLHNEAHNEAHKWAKDNNPERCILHKNLCSLYFNGMEILVEYSGSSGHSVDIMVQSCQSREVTVEFVESHIITRIRRLCASPKGCQGVTLAEAIIRPGCVAASGITLCRYRQSILVDELKQHMATTENYMHNWDTVKGEDGGVILHAAVHDPLALLDGEVQEEELEAGPSSQEAPAPDFNDMPKFIRLTSQDVGLLYNIAETIPKPWRAEPFRLHLQCECREGHHDVKNQPGRTFYVADQSYVMMQGVRDLAVEFVAIGLKVGGLFVPGLGVAGDVASRAGGQTSKGIPVFPFDIETLSQRKTTSWPSSGQVPRETLRKEVEKDLQISTCAEDSWLRAFLNPGPGAQAFAKDFRLKKVQYTTPPRARGTAWLCDEHFAKARAQRSIRWLS